MLWLKVTGGIMVMCASALIGYFYSQKNEIRAADLLEMKKALTLLKSEIRFALSPFGEAARDISERVESPVSNIFGFAAEKALTRNGSEAFEIWESAVNSVSGNTFYTKEDITAFLSMGRNLGYLDKEMQNQSIDLLIDYIDGAVAELRQSGAKQSQMYKSLGVLGGLLITVILL